MLMITINFYIFLYVAMLNDGVVVVYFNHFGEGITEYIIYTLLLPMIILSSILHIKSFRKTKKEDLKNVKKISNRDTKNCIRNNQTE